MKLDLPVKNASFLKRLERRIKGKSYIPACYHNNKCIFVHIPKSAGTSIKNALFPGENKITHRLALDYYHDEPSAYKQYFSFAFSRNPYDRVVSAYNYLMQGGKNDSDKKFRDEHLLEYKDFTDFIKRGLGRPEIMSWYHFIPQHYFVVNFSGDVIVNFIGKMENIDSDFEYVAKKLNINCSLQHNNPSKRGHYSDYFNEETAKIVLKEYLKDFEIFNYNQKLTSTQDI